MKQPYRRASRLAPQALFSRGSYLRLTKQSLFVAGLLIGLLAMAAPALAEYLGPDRVTTEFVTVRDPDNDVWTLTHVDPGDGLSDVCLIIHTCDEHPSVERQLALCGWVADNSGCTMAYKTEEQAVILPEATIVGDLVNCSLEDGWCTTTPSLHLVGSEPLAGEAIDQIEGTRNGVTFVCGGAECDMPLLQGDNAFTFWANSSYGDTSQMGTLSAKVDSLGPGVSIPDSWFIWEPVAIGVDDAGAGVSQVTLTVDGGSYGLRKYSWGNLNLVPDDFVWDRHFGEIIAPIGDYPVTVTATDTLGNLASAVGEIVILDPNAKAGSTGGLGASSRSDLVASGSSDPSRSLDGLLDRLPNGELAAGREGAGSAESSPRRTPSSSGRTGPDRGIARSTTNETSAAEMPPGAEPSTVSSKGSSSGILWGGAALVAAGATTAYALNRRSQREALLEERRREFATATSSEGRRSRLTQLWNQAQARVAPIRAGMLAAAAAVARVAQELQQRRKVQYMLMQDVDPDLSATYQLGRLYSSQGLGGETPVPPGTATPQPSATPAPVRAPYPPGFQPLVEPWPRITGGALLDGAGYLWKYGRTGHKIYEAWPLRFAPLDSGKIGVRVSDLVPSGERLARRLELDYAGTRYNVGTLGRVTAGNLIRGAARNVGMAIPLFTTLAANIYEFGWGSQRERGIRSNEFAASAMVDFGAAALTGLAAAGLVAGAIVVLTAAGFAAAATAPLAAVLAVTAILGVGLGFALDYFVDTDRLKANVANGLSAWGGIATNAATIMDVARQRVGEAVGNAVLSVRDAAAASAQTVSRGIQTAAQAVSGAAEQTWHAAETAAEQVATATRDAVSMVREGAAQVVETARETVGSAVEAARGFFQGLFGGQDS